MWKTRTNGEFDFYEIEYQLGEDILRFVLKSSREQKSVFIVGME